VFFIRLKVSVLKYLCFYTGGGFFSIRKSLFLFSYFTYCVFVLQGNSFYFDLKNSPEIVTHNLQVSSLGNFVWEDMNGNGIQDPSENGLNGIRVVLEDTTGAQISSIFTSNGGSQNRPGYYQFGNLTPGVYQLRFVIPLLFKFTKRDAGGNDDFDSDVDTVTGLIKPIILEEGEQKFNLDAGLIKTASLGNYVWLDRNGNGIQEFTESGLNGIPVQLFNEQGILLGVKSTTVNPNTGSNGWYEFTQVIPGKYYLSITPPPAFGFIPTIPNNTIETLDSDITGAFGPFTTDLISLASGQNFNDLDGGFYQDNSIGDYVWEDVNLDGIQDANETGLNGIMVSLWDAFSKNMIDQQVTRNHPSSGKAGYYLFDNLRIGTYFIKVELPKSYVWTTSNQKSDLLDSDIDETNGPNTTGNYFVGGNNHNLTVDAGMVKGVKVGNYVWNDTGIGNTGMGVGALNGKQDLGELPQQNVTIYLRQYNSAKVWRTQSDSNGLYLFYVKPNSGSYFLEFEIGSQYAFTTSDYNNNVDDVNDSDVNGANGMRTTPTFYVDSLDDLKWDAGIYLKSLPLELVSFNGIQNLNIIELNWETLNEFNTSHFEVERKSKTGSKFISIGRVEAKNNTIQACNYSFEDRQIIEEDIYFYRLKMVDQNQSYSYSDIISVVFQNNKSNKGLKINIYPNPISGNLNLELFTERNDEVGYSIFDVSGFKLIEGKFPINGSSSQKIQLDLRSFEPGLYLIKVSNSAEQKIYKIQFTH